MSRKNKTTKSSEPLCFCCWLHKKEAIDNMKDEEAGVVFKALYEYAKFGTKKNFDERFIAYVYNDMCNDIDRFYERHGISRTDPLEDIITDDDVVIPTTTPSNKPVELDSELVYTTDEGFVNELTEDESMILYLINKAREKFPVRSDGTWRASMKWLKGQLSDKWDDNRITKTKESLRDKGYIEYKKDEEARYHLYKILKPVTYNKVG